MTANTPEAGMDERAAFEAWYFAGGVPASASERNGDSYKYMGAHVAWGVWKAARANLPLPQGDAELAIDNVLCSVLPGVYYMDPPDGGSITPLEQVQRMAKDAARYRWLRSYASVVHWNRLGHYGDGELDAQIDAAIAAGLTPGGQ